MLAVEARVCSTEARMSVTRAFRETIEGPGKKPAEKVYAGLSNLLGLDRPDHRH